MIIWAGHYKHKACRHKIMKETWSGLRIKLTNTQGPPGPMMMIISIVRRFDGRFPMRSERDLFRWHGQKPLIGAQRCDEMQRVAVLLTGKICLEQITDLMHLLVFSRMWGRNASPKAGIDFIARLKLMGNGSARSCFASRLHFPFLKYLFLFF